LQRETVIDAQQDCLDHKLDAMRFRRTTVEPMFGTLKARMGALTSRQQPSVGISIFPAVD
jgi:hypothetical protein